MADKSKTLDAVAPDTKLKPKPAAAVDGEAAVLPSDAALSARARRVWPRACCGVAVLIAGVAVATLVLSLTVLKVRDPTLSMNSISVQWYSVRVDAKAARPVLINVTLLCDIAIENPNVDSLRFGVSTTEIYIDGAPEAVGVGRTPPGTVAARSTSQLRLGMDLLVDRVGPAVVSTVLFGDGEVRLTTRTAVNGRVSMLGGLYGRREVSVAMRCGVTLRITLTAVKADAPACVADFGQ